MTKAQHTPGPWETDSNGKIWGDVNNETLDGDSPLLAEMFGNGKEQRANSHLIAAAPDMLEALELILEVLPTGTHPWEINTQEMTARELARNAIAKARGEKELAA